jgi:predicted regulator of Ras-like GTPase activity (Roadblock/LC7/MglB family)
MDELKSGVPSLVVVNGKNKTIIVTGAGSNALLAVITSKQSDILDKTIAKVAKNIEKSLREKK